MAVDAAGWRDARRRGPAVALLLVAMSLTWPTQGLAASSPSARATPTTKPTAKPTTTRGPTSTPTPQRTADPAPTRTPTPSPAPTRTAPTTTAGGSDPTRTPTPKPTPTRTTPSPSLTPTGITTPSPTSAQPVPIPNCVPKAPNLVQNPGFEQVSGPSTPQQSGFFSILSQGATGWNLTAPSSAGVPGWTGTSVYGLGYPRVAVVNNGTYLGQTTPHGTRFALVPGWLGNRPEQIAGTLTPPASAGQAYLLSVDIAKIGMGYPPKVELWLRNSVTGAQSASLVQQPGNLSINWQRLAGVLTTTASYDQVVLRFAEVPQDYWNNYFLGPSTWLGLADDLRVCRVATSLPAIRTGFWTSQRAVGVAAVGAVFLGTLGWIVLRRLRVPPGTPEAG